MKILQYMTLSASIAFLLYACGGTEDDPATASRDDFNPPGNLFTVTQDSAIQLRWTTGNVEDDFQGYYVFGTTKTIDELKALVKYPTAGQDVTKAGIPRCLDNSAFFEAFGMPASENDCEGKDEESPAEGGGEDSLQSRDDSFLLDDENTSLTGWVTCGEGAAKPSVAVTKSTTIQKCTVSAIKDSANADVALVNGTTYTFMVMGVMDDFEDLSWTSNVVSDTPAKTALDGASLTVGGDQYATITFSPIAAVDAAVVAPVACSGNKACKLSEANANTTAVPTIFIARDEVSGDYPQRLYVSTSSVASTDGWSLVLQARGPQTNDPMTDATYDARVPGDQATLTYPTAGRKEILYNNQVFDIKATKDGASYYGKLVVGDVTYAGDANSIATVQVFLVLQTTAGVRDYFQTNFSF